MNSESPSDLRSPISGALAGLCLLVFVAPHLFPFGFAFPRAVFGLKTFWILSGGALLCLLHVSALRKNERLDLRTELERPLLAVLFTSLFSILFASRPLPLFRPYIGLLGHCAVFYLFIDIRRKAKGKGRGLRSPLLWAFLTGVLAAIHIIFQSYGLDFFNLSGGVPDWRGKLAAFIGGPNFVAGYLAMILPFGIWWTVSAPKRSFWFRWALLIPILMALTVTWSVGAWSGLLAAFVFSLFHRDSRKAFTKPRGLAVFGVFVFAFSFYMLDNPYNGIGRSIIKEAMNSGRWKTGAGARGFIFGVTAEMLKDHPVVGVGFGAYHGNYHIYEGRYRGKLDEPYVRRNPPEVPQAHNEYYQHLAETGLIGFAAMLWLLAAGVRRLRRIAGELPEAEQGIWWACLCGFTVGAVHALQSFPLHIPTNALLLVLLASRTFAPTTGLTEKRVFRLRRGSLLTAGSAALFAAAVWASGSPMLSDWMLTRSLQPPPDPEGVMQAIVVDPYSERAWTAQSLRLESIGETEAAVLAAREAALCLESVGTRQRVRDLLRGDFRAPYRGSRERLLAALLEGRKTLALNPTYAPLLVEQAILEYEAGDEGRAKELIRQAAAHLITLPEEASKEIVDRQAWEIMRYKQGHPEVIGWLEEEIQRASQGGVPKSKRVVSDKTAVFARNG